MKIIVQFASGLREKKCQACHGSEFVESVEFNKRDGGRNRWFVCASCNRVGSFTETANFDASGNLFFNTVSLT